jgi:hypothetical protein
MFEVTEHIAWDKRVEFTISSFKEMAQQLKEFVAIRKIKSGRKYRVIIEEI